MNKLASFVCLLALLQTSFADTSTTEAKAIQPCREILERTTGPITKQCAAAAIAEDSFLQETHHQVTKYSIYAMKNTATEWRFMILLAEEGAAAAPGEHYMVFVDRVTRKTLVTPGK